MREGVPIFFLGTFASIVGAVAWSAHVLSKRMNTDVVFASIIFTPISLIVIISTMVLTYYYPLDIICLLGSICCFFLPLTVLSIIALNAFGRQMLERRYKVTRIICALSITFIASLLLFGAMIIIISPEHTDHSEIITDVGVYNRETALSSLRMGFAGVFISSVLIGFGSGIPLQSDVRSKRKQSSFGNSKKGGIVKYHRDRTPQAPPSGPPAPPRSGPLSPIPSRTCTSGRPGSAGRASPPRP